MQVTCRYSAMGLGGVGPSQTLPKQTLVALVARCGPPVLTVAPSSGATPPVVFVLRTAIVERVAWAG